MLRLLFQFILTTYFIVLVATQTPKYKCEGGFECIVTKIKVTKDQPIFELEADEPFRVLTLKISESEIPILKLNQICSEFRNLGFLEAKKNVIEELPPDAFENCNRLFLIDLRDNRLRQLPDNVFKTTPSLNSLVLAGNRLQALSEALFKFSILEQFNIEGNLITELPQNLFYNTPNMTELNVSNNRLKEIPLAAIKYTPELRKFIFDSNDIVRFDDKKIMEILTGLKEIAFNYNLLACERYNELVASFEKKGVKVLPNAILKKRYIDIVTIGAEDADKIYCVADVEWTASYYKQVAEKDRINKLREEVMNLRELLKSFD